MATRIYELPSASLVLVTRSYGPEFHLRFRTSIPDDEMSALATRLLDAALRLGSSWTLVIEEEGDNKPQLSLSSLQTLLDAFGERTSESRIRCSVVLVREVTPLVRMLFAVWAIFMKDKVGGAPVMLTDDEAAAYAWLLDPS